MLRRILKIRLLPNESPESFHVRRASATNRLSKATGGLWIERVSRRFVLWFWKVAKLPGRRLLPKFFRFRDMEWNALRDLLPQVDRIRRYRPGRWSRVDDAFRPLGPRWFAVAAETSEKGWLQRCAGIIRDLASNR